MAHIRRLLKTNKALLAPGSIALDVDGVLADFYTHLKGDADHKGVIIPQKADVSEWDFMTGHPEREKLLEIAATPQFCRTIPREPGSEDLELLLRSHQATARTKCVHLVTAPLQDPGTGIPYVTWISERSEWCVETGVMGMANALTYASKKHEACGATLLIDDRPENCHAWEASREDRLAILWAQPWNILTGTAPALKSQTPA